MRRNNDLRCFTILLCDVILHILEELQFFRQEKWLMICRRSNVKRREALLTYCWVSLWGADNKKWVVSCLFVFCLVFGFFFFLSKQEKQWYVRVGKNSGKTTLSGRGAKAQNHVASLAISDCGVSLSWWGERQYSIYRHWCTYLLTLVYIFIDIGVLGKAWTVMLLRGAL